ncbi:tektin-4-like [Frankliniella occidentalis]|uniref:Tektin n=1 Tax=Frankliniella occidentalis TaxID=133901 RepID=A0A9C6U543_FRAOC|nr:tektin-4-like [Frankliniella occidentalis]
MSPQNGVEEASEEGKRWETAEMGPVGPADDVVLTPTAAPEDAPVPAPAHPFVTELGPVGPWAFGRTEWNPASGLTGVRPVVDRYSVTRFSPGDWLRHNAELTATATAARQRGDAAAWSAREVRRRAAAELDALHRDSSDRLQERAQHVWRWRAELERAAEVMWDEIQLLQQTPPRLNRILAALAKAAAVASECIAVRCKRPDTDLIRDPAHDQLVREAALIREVTAMTERCLKQAVEQIRADRAALVALQADWSCKKDCYRVDTLARAVTAHREPLVGVFQEGAAVVPDRQVTPGDWEQSTRRNIAASEAERQRSIAFRTLLQPMLDGAVRDVRAQAARVDDALARNVALVARAVEHFDEQYRLTVRKEADTETLIEALRVAIRNTDPNLKTAQSRLHTRQQRMASENCRDPPQAGLLEEVSRVTIAATALDGQLRNSTNALHEIREERARLEACLVLKRKHLHLDRDRVLQLREHFPTAGSLSGLN